MPGGKTTDHTTVPIHAFISSPTFLPRGIFTVLLKFYRIKLFRKINYEQVTQSTENPNTKCCKAYDLAVAAPDSKQSTSVSRALDGSVCSVAHERTQCHSRSASLEPQPKGTSGLRSRSNVTNPRRHILSDVKGPQLLLGTHWSFHLCTDTLTGKMSHPDFPPSSSINNSLENHWLYTPGRTTRLIKNITPKKNHDG